MDCAGDLGKDFAMNFYSGLEFTSFDYLYGTAKARSDRYVIKYYDSDTNGVPLWE